MDLPRRTVAAMVAGGTSEAGAYVAAVADVGASLLWTRLGAQINP